MGFIKKLFFLITLTAFFISCDLFTGKEVVLRLPEVPEFVLETSEGGLPDLSPWTVSWLDESGTVRSTVVKTGGAVSVVAVRPGQIPWLIATARPAGDFRPAGICAALSGNEFRFSWQDGAAAQLFLDVFPAAVGSGRQDLLYRSNVGLIAKGFRDKGDPSPWIIDRAAMKIHLLSGTLNGNLFRKKGLRVFPEVLPEIIGSWDQCMEMLSDDGVLCLDGKNVWYSAQCKITVNAGTDGWQMVKMYGDGSTDVSFGSW